MGTRPNAGTTVAFDQTPRRGCFDYRYHRYQATLGSFSPNVGGHRAQRRRQPSPTRAGRGGRRLFGRPSSVDSYVLNVQQKHFNNVYRAKTPAKTKSEIRISKLRNPKRLVWNLLIFEHFSSFELAILDLFNPATRSDPRSSVFVLTMG